MPKTEHDTPSKQYESRHRLTWAAQYPLLPGRDLTTRQALLLQIADTAITGEYFESQKKLAGKLGLSIRGVQKVLAKLCAEGALTAQRRGFKRTTRYRLQRLAEVAEHGAFLPPGEAKARPVERNSSTSQTHQPPPLETNPSSPQIAFETNPSSYTKKLQEEEEERPPLTPPLIFQAPEPGTITPTARRLHEHFVEKTGRPLPGSWVRYPELKQELDRFPDVRSVLEGMLNRTGGYLPEPEQFFKNYAPSPIKRKRDRRRRRAA